MKNFPYKSTLRRYNLLALVFILVGIAIVGKTAYIMFVKRTFWKEVGARNVRENVSIPASRGNILSADGQLLATALPDYKVYLDFVVTDPDEKTQAKAQRLRDSLFNDKADSLAQGLNRMFPDKSTKWFLDHLMTGYKKRSRHWVIYPKRISYTAFKEIKKLPYLCLSKRVTGLHEEGFNDIKKPFGSLAARTLGDTYPGKDSARSGLQLAYDTLLRGKPGISHRQKVLNSWLSITDQPPVDGADIMTTIDVRMQDFAEKALKEQMDKHKASDGVVLLMEVATGDVKAIVNLSRVSDGTLKESRNIAVSNLMEPGSVFKPISFLVALNDGQLHIDDKVDCNLGKKEMYGRIMKDHNWNKGGYGVLTVSQCLEQSSNIGVSVLIDRIYHHHPEKFVDGLYRTGIAEDLHLDIPGYVRPRIRRPYKDKTGKHWANWYNTALPWMSIGYETQVPPISVLSFYNGIANNGKMMRPRFVTSAMRNGEIIAEYPPQVIRERMASPKAIKDLQICLHRVVSIGLGKRAGSPLFSVSGKTGTAQIWNKSGNTRGFLVSFVGYFPSEKPLYSCMVCMIKSGWPASGGQQCGPVFKAVAEMVMQRTMRPDLNLLSDSMHHHTPIVCKGNMKHASEVLDFFDYHCDLPTTAPTGGFQLWGKAEQEGKRYRSENIPIQTTIVPDVTGMGARDAVYLLESLGMKVSIEGFGTVVQQSLPYGHLVVKKEHIHLKLAMKKYNSKANKEATPVTQDTVSHPISEQPN